MSGPDHPNPGFSPFLMDIWPRIRAPPHGDDRPKLRILRSPYLVEFYQPLRVVTIG